MDIKEEIVSLIGKEVSLKKQEIRSLIEVPPNSNFGDYAFPCFKLGGHPVDEAGKLTAKLKKTKLIDRIEQKGPYINFFIDKQKLAEIILSKIFQDKKRYGSSSLGKNRHVVIDFSSPNIAKPFGVGHLRSTVLGNSLYKIHNFLGYKSVGVNHLGDWGTQFGKLIVAYKKWGREKQLQKEPIKYLLKLYVKFHRESEKNEELNEQARQWFKKLEDGNREALALWKTFRRLSIEEFNRIYEILDVKFDYTQGESFYNKILPQTVEEVRKKEITKEDQDALVVDLEKYGLPNLVILKSDGATTYATRDIAAALYRLRKFSPAKLLYVVGSEQKLYWQQLFKTLELMGRDPEKFTHINFGFMRFREKRMSTRKGEVIFLEEVLNKAVSLAEKIINKKNPKLKNKKTVARQVGVGAVIFWDLKNDRINDVVFDWNKILDFEGETAPYAQYTHARACSILKKAEQGLSSKINFETFNQPEEIKLIKLLGNFPDIVSQSADHCKPHLLARYLINLAQSFNEFYHKCPVISEMKHVMKARLLLVNSVRQALANGLNLLGIDAPEEM